MRPSKTTVDYFPHMTTSGKTIFILEKLYGNDGYAAWFKILELLGSTPGHAYDFNSPANFQFLVAKIGVSGEKTLDILNSLSELGAIDAELFQMKVLWSDNFLERLSVVYDKRRTKTPIKPEFSGRKPHVSDESGEKTPQIKLNKSKENIYGEKFIFFWDAYPKKSGKFEASKAFEKVKVDLDVLLKAVENQKKSKNWLKNDGQFIPHASTWLNQKRWEDVVEVEEKKDTTGICYNRKYGYCQKDTCIRCDKYKEFQPKQ